MAQRLGPSVQKRKKDLGLSLSPPTKCTDWGMALPVIMDFKPQELWENKFLLFEPPSLCYFHIVAQAN